MAARGSHQVSIHLSFYILLFKQVLKVNVFHVLSKSSVHHLLNGKWNVRLQDLKNESRLP